jgi:hypothetical protein
VSAVGGLSGHRSTAWRYEEAGAKRSLGIARFPALRAGNAPKNRKIVIPGRCLRKGGL